MTTTLPALLDVNALSIVPGVSEQERRYLQQASNLLRDGYCDHSLLDVWNAAVSNLRRRVEMYGLDLFLSVVKDEPGRKRYAPDGETLADRWSGVDELVLIEGATRLGLVNKKAGKALEMINWMRNHASAAHAVEDRVEREDVVGLVLILQKNLFEAPMPDPGHSVSGLFDPVKRTRLDDEAETLLKDQIRGLRFADIKVAFGFLLDQLVSGLDPASDNASKLLPEVWERSSDDLKRIAGLRYHALTLDPASDESPDKGARERLLDFLVQVGGIQFIPDAARASLFRRAASALARAKDSSYGWEAETVAAKTLSQFGPCVPAIAFEEVYQEILAVWCGNYWGRSKAHLHLGKFIDTLSTGKIRSLIGMFTTNERVRAELTQTRPRNQAVEFLRSLRDRLTIETHKDEVNQAINSLP